MCGKSLLCIFKCDQQCYIPGCNAVHSSCVILSYYHCVAPSSALIYSPLESVIGHYRGEEDSLNSVAAATLTGVMYKSTGKR